MRSRILVALLVAAPALTASLATSAQAGKLDGISYLVSVTQMKANNANDCQMAAIEGDCDDPPPPPPPPPPKKPKGSALTQSSGQTFNSSVGAFTLGF